MHAVPVQCTIFVAVGWFFVRSFLCFVLFCFRVLRPLMDLSNWICTVVRIYLVFKLRVHFVEMDLHNANS